MGMLHIFSHRTVVLSSLGLLLLGGCGGEGETNTSAWDPEASEGDDGAAGTGQGPAGGDDQADDSGGADDPTGQPGDDTEAPPMQDLVEVGHEREFRGVWVATVSNINFPSQTGLTVTEMEEELIATLDTLAAYNLNAILFQIRPECDAFYPSDLEPWSRYLTGSQGGDPGFDPLQFVIDEAHERGIEVHGWVNPYRAKANRNSTAVAPHLSITQSEHAHVYGELLWMDPAAEAVQDYTVDVILDVVDRYDIDGIHFDDYFYPYPNGSQFPDSGTWQDYQNGGGDLGLNDWRRDNVNRLVQALHEEITAADPNVRFGISPFGIYRPGMPPGITGLDQYDEIFADPLEWMEQGWVDYLAPQLYWPTTQTAQAYEPLLEWWASMTSGGRYIFAGNYLSQLGSSASWTVDEFVEQVDISRTYRDLNSMGNIYFHIAPFESDQSGIATTLAETFYTQPVLTPPLAAQAASEVEPPLVQLSGATANLTPQDDTALRAFVVYRSDGDGFALDRIVPASQTSIDLEPGTWAISAAGKHGVESMGVRIVVGQ